MLDVATLSSVITFALLSSALAFALSPFLTHFLYKYNITAGRRGGFDPTLLLESRKDKIDTPTMGGILIIVTIALITFIFNWDRSFTWVPIGVMLLSAFLGGLDDLLNIFGTRRRSRKVAHVWNLIKVHKSFWVKVWFALTMPWTIFKRTSVWLGSHPGRGIHVHEKFIMQFVAGGITAWWVYWKLGLHWREIAIPFDSSVNIGILIVPLIILVVIAAANSVNIADGLDGLAGGALIPTFAALGLLAWVKDMPEIAILNALTVGALITYTYFNVKPARFQMGDVGSLGLGALMGINAVVLNAIVALPFLAFIFVIETLTVIIQVIGRNFFGKRVFKMAPLHHHYELKGWSEEKIVMRFWLVHLAAVVFGLWFALH